MNRFKKELQLVNYANSIIGLPFMKGITDCNVIALSVIDLYKGTEYAKLVKGKYTSYKAGYKVAADKIGFTRMSDLLNDIATPIDINLVTVGDIITQPSKNYDACYICLGGSCLVASTETMEVEVQYVDLEDLEEAGATAFRL